MSTAETEVFVPYSRRAPDTDDVNLLRAEHLLQIELHGRRSSEAAESFQHLFRASCKKGHPLDALSKHSRNEVERFFAQTVAGVDGHVYWDGAKHGFTRNDGKHRSARRWWWAHRAGMEPPRELDVVPMCGEKNCINPEHCETGRDLRRRKFSDEQMLGALQVAAMRLGHSPSTREWRRSGGEPTTSVYMARYGSWAAAIQMAGLAPVVPQYFELPHDQASPEDCRETLRRTVEFLGRSPSTKDLRDPQVKAMLQAAGLPVTAEAIGKHLGDGSWKVALIREGLTPGVGGYSPGPAYSPGSAIAAVRLIGSMKGGRPATSHFRDPKVRAALKERGLPMTCNSVKRALGDVGWQTALEQAGLADA